MSLDEKNSKFLSLRSFADQEEDRRLHNLCVTGIPYRCGRLGITSHMAR